ncbi:RlpA-like double-psi beta-barrel-protein domain-containing protein-containing protein, partial [Gymnopilus junonius]
LGSCGFWNMNKERVVALNPIDYAGGTRCGKWVHLNYQGKTARAKVVDLCPSCGLTGIDLSPAAFRALAPLDVGQLHIDWEYV